MLFAKYEEKLTAFVFLPVCAGVQSAGTFHGFVAVCPFRQDKNQEDTSENAKHEKDHKRHFRPGCTVRAIRSQ
jgi:hypothetical protein